MLKILLPVDGSGNSDRAARHLIGMAGHCGAMDIRVVNVQPPFLNIEVLLKPRQEVLDAAGLLLANLFNIAILAVDDVFYLNGPSLVDAAPSHGVTALAGAGAGGKLSA